MDALAKIIERIFGPEPVKDATKALAVAAVVVGLLTYGSFGLIPANRRVAALIVGVAAIGLIAIATILVIEKYGRSKHIAIPELQILTVFPIPEENEQRDNRMREVFSHRTTSIRLLARTGASFLSSHGKNWRYDDGVGMEAILEARSIPVTVILQNPYSENGRCRRRSENDVPPWNDVSWGHLTFLANEYPKLQLYFTSAPILCSLFFTDECVFYDPYRIGKREPGSAAKNDFLVIEFANETTDSGKNYYGVLESLFDFILNDELTLPYEKFSEEYGGHIDGGTHCPTLSSP